MNSATRTWTGPPPDPQGDLDAAHRLARALANGGWLRPIAVDGAPLDAGENAYADLRANGWRYLPLCGVAYERRTFLAGGLVTLALAVAISAMGNRRARHAAERAAAPQSRPLGPLRIIVTSQRLLVWFENAWWPVWYSAVTDIRHDPARRSLDLHFDNDPPYRVAGPDIPALAVISAHENHGEAPKSHRKPQCAAALPTLGLSGGSEPQQVTARLHHGHAGPYSCAIWGAGSRGGTRRANCARRPSS